MTHGCVICGGTLPAHPHGGRPREVCGPVCFRVREKARPRGGRGIKPKQTACLVCESTIAQGGRGPLRKTCGPKCKNKFDKAAAQAAGRTVKWRRCLICRAKFGRRIGAKTCSPSCGAELQARRRAAKLKSRPCLVCGIEFSGRPGGCCSEACHRARKRDRDRSFYQGLSPDRKAQKKQYILGWRRENYATIDAVVTAMAEEGILDIPRNLPSSEREIWKRAALRGAKELGLI